MNVCVYVLNWSTFASFESSFGKRKRAKLLTGCKNVIASRRVRNLVMQVIASESERANKVFNSISFILRYFLPSERKWIEMN